MFLVTIDESEKWDAIAKSFKNHDVYYLSSYVKGLQIHEHDMPILFYFENDETRAFNVVIKRDIAKDNKFKGRLCEKKYYDIITPYGYGGFLVQESISKSSMEQLDNDYKKLCMENGIISEFVRFHPILQNADIFQGMYNEKMLGETVTMNLDTREQIWDNMASTCRNRIRKSLKEGVEVYWGRSPELYREFLKIYSTTMDRKNATDFYYFEDDYFNSIMNDLRYHSIIFYALYQGQIISMAIIMFCNTQMHYHLGGSYREYQNLAPANQIFYEAACWGSENGFLTFHLGGGLGCQDDNLYRFKKTFNKNSNTVFSIGNKIFDEEKYKELINIRSEEKDFCTETSFFPVYRG